MMHVIASHHSSTIRELKFCGYKVSSFQPMYVKDKANNRIVRPALQLLLFLHLANLPNVNLLLTAITEAPSPSTNPA